MDYGSVADDFFVNMSLQTTLDLPANRETVLHFCEAVQKQFRTMTGLYQREGGQFVLEGDRDGGNYRWLELQTNRLSAGHFNPPDVADGYELHRWLLDRSVYYLGVSGLDVDCLDVLFGFNLDYMGNRDAIVAQALLAGSPLSAFAGDGPEKCVECEPSFVIAMDEECDLQARVHIETHSNTYQVRTGNYEDEPISIYLTVRQYPRSGQVFDIPRAFARQCAICEELTERAVIPSVVQTISAAIASGH